MTCNLDSEDSLYGLACECEELFNQVQEAIPKTRLEVMVIELFAEFQQRFSIWAAHLGVFARKSQCLDTRLRNLPDLQDLVARLLDILRRNLQQCKNEIDSQRERNQAPIGLDESKASLTQTETLAAIDNTLARLNRLGVTIRRSSYDKVDERATKFAAGLELESFLYLCANAVQTLYPNAQQSLKDYLSKSMTDRYAKMLFLYSRHHNLKIRREPPIKLPPIPELPNNETQDNVRLTQPAGAIPVVAKFQRLPTLLSQSDLSSVNIQKIQSRPRPPDEASTIFYKTSSVQVNQGNYPQQPIADGDSAVFTCEWCFELLNKEILSESKWRQHIDRDLEPYICLSEECSEMHPIYPTFDKWFSHMESHGRRWHQQVYLSSSWVCTVCEFNPDVYSNPQALYSHLKASHDGEFTNEELQVISRQSKTEQPRAWNDCLLCCFAIDEQGDRSEVRPPERWKESPKQKIAAGPKETYTTTNISHHSSDSDFSDTSSDSDDMVSQRQRLQQTQSRSKAIARHIAVHLQVLMLLTLRFAALQKDDEALDDDIRSDSVDIDDANSASMGNDLGRLSDIDLELDVMDDGNNSGNAMNLDDAVEDDIQIPDTDLDLNYVPRPYDSLVAENDAFLKKMIESGAYQPISQDYAKAVCVIPYPRNKDLVHRQDLIDQVDRLLPQTPGFCSAALWGLGGSGKTQIALDYAHRRGDDSKCCVFWVHADSEAAFIADYKTIGKRLGVDKRLNEWNLLDAVRSSIEAQSQWVVIFDDADDLKLFGVGYTEGENESLFRYIPRGPRGTILWTSRDAHIGGTLVDSHQSIKVPCMTHDEAIALLAVARGDKVTVRDEGIYELLEGLQRLPLAVWQAGSYIRQTSMAIKEYLRLLTQGSSRWDLLRMDNLDRYQRPGVPNYLLEIWKISIERIREENELSYRILHIITYLNIQDIPYKVIVAASQYNGDEDRLEQIPEIEIQQAIVRLRKFSFLNILQEEGGLQSYIMHKVTQEAVRYVLGIQGPMKTTLSKSTPRQIKQEAHNLNFALHILYAIFSVLEKDSWEQCEGYISRAMQVTEWSEASGKEVEASALLDRVSGFLYDRGWWREKEPVDRRLLDLRRKALGEEHPDTITSMASLAATYHEQGRYGEAVMLETQVLDLRQKVLGEKHPDTITSMASLVATYHEQGRYNDAEMLESQVLCLRQEVLGEEHPHTMESMADLAAISHVQTQFKEHKPLR